MARALAYHSRLPGPTAANRPSEPHLHLHNQLPDLASMQMQLVRVASQSNRYWLSHQLTTVSPKFSRNFCTLVALAAGHVPVNQPGLVERTSGRVIESQPFAVRAEVQAPAVADIAGIAQRSGLAHHLAVGRVDEVEAVAVEKRQHGPVAAQGQVFGLFDEAIDVEEGVNLQIAMRRG